MGRTKGSKNKSTMEKEELMSQWDEETIGVAAQLPITPVSVDFSSEQLNNLAMKLNEVIARLNQ